QPKLEQLLVGKRSPGKSLSRHCVLKHLPGKEHHGRGTQGRESCAVKDAARRNPAMVHAGFPSSGSILDAGRGRPMRAIADRLRQTQQIKLPSIRRNSMGLAYAAKARRITILSILQRYAEPAESERHVQDPASMWRHLLVLHLRHGNNERFLNLFLNECEPLF